MALKLGLLAARARPEQGADNSRAACDGRAVYSPVLGPSRVCHGDVPSISLSADVRTYLTMAVLVLNFLYHMWPYVGELFCQRAYPATDTPATRRCRRSAASILSSSCSTWRRGRYSIRPERRLGTFAAQDVSRLSDHSNNIQNHEMGEGDG